MSCIMNARPFLDFLRARSAVIHASGGINARFVVQANSWEVYSFFAQANLVANDTYVIANNLGGGNQSIRLISILEPAFTGASAGSNLTFAGFYTDGAARAPTPRTRNIELVGDSISAGYGSRGYKTPAPPPYGCPVTPATCGNYYSYNWMIAEAFNANIVPIAWSGKASGMRAGRCGVARGVFSVTLALTTGGSYFGIQTGSTGLCLR